MKKLIITILTLGLLVSGFTVYAANNANENAVGLENPERQNTVIITLLIPEIQKAVNEFYEPYLSIAPTVVAYLGDAKMIDIVGETDSSRYTVTVEAEPYIGPHIQVGRDSITFDVLADGTVNLKNYEHLKSYELPPHLQSLIKKPLP